MLCPFSLVSCRDLGGHRQGPAMACGGLFPAGGITEQIAVLETLSHSEAVSEGSVVRSGGRLRCTHAPLGRPSRPPPPAAEVLRPRPRCRLCPVQLAVLAVRLGPGEVGAGAAAFNQVSPQVPGQVSLSPRSQEAGKPGQQRQALTSPSTCHMRALASMSPLNSDSCSMR